MIILSYPVGAGGNFFGSLLALLINNCHNQVLADGSMHSVPKHGYTGIKIVDSSIDFTEQGTYKNYFKNKNPLHTPIIITHMEDLTRLTELLPGWKLVYITITDFKWIGIQQANFLKKVIIGTWSKNLYQAFAGPDWPAFNQDVSQMPQWVIDDMLNINSKYINSWKFTLPEDHAHCLEIPMELTVHPSLLLNRIITFFNLHPSEEQHQQALDLINNYIKINNYE